jgi:hypothetical protein
MPKPPESTKRQPDITKAKQLLDWEPTVSLEDGLKETIGYIRTKISELSEWDASSFPGEPKRPLRLQPGLCANRVGSPADRVKGKAIGE